MQLIVYLVLFIIFSPRYFFSLAKTSNRITYKEVISHAAVFGFAVVILQWVSKRYGILEGFTANNPTNVQEVMNTINGMTANGMTANGNATKKPTA